MEDCHEPSRDAVQRAMNGIEQDLQHRLAVVTPSSPAESIALIAGHLRPLVADLHPTTSEVRQALGFLTEVGHHTDYKCPERMLLADVLGVSAVIMDLNTPQPQGVTPNTVAGPFYRADAPEMALGADLSRDGKGKRLRDSGRITNIKGRAVPGVLAEVWHANAGRDL